MYIGLLETPTHRRIACETESTVTTAESFGAWPVWGWQDKGDTLPATAFGPDGELPAAVFDRIFTRSNLWMPLGRLGEDRLFASRSAVPSRQHPVDTTRPNRKPRFVLPISISDLPSPYGPLTRGVWFVFRTTACAPRLIEAFHYGERVTNRRELAALVLAWHRRHGRLAPQAASVPDVPDVPSVSPTADLPPLFVGAV